MLVFDFLRTEFDYGEFFDANQTPGNSGVILSQDEYGSSFGRYAVTVSIIVGTGTPKTFAEWLTFLRAIRGGFDVFLFKDGLNPLLYAVTNVNIGTGNGSNKDFALAHSCIDAATVIVKDDGNVVSGANYSLEDNNTSPKIRFVTAPLNGHIITISYEFYYPVKFASEPRGGRWQYGAYIINDLEIVEDGPNAHLAPYET